MIANNIFFLVHYSLVKIYLLYPDLYRKSNMEKSNDASCLIFFFCNESVALVSISPTPIKLLLPKGFPFSFYSEWETLFITVELKSNVSHILDHVNLHALHFVNRKLLSHLISCFTKLHLSIYDHWIQQSLHFLTWMVLTPHFISWVWVRQLLRD